MGLRRIFLATTIALTLAGCGGAAGSETTAVTGQAPSPSPSAGSRPDPAAPMVPSPAPSTSPAPTTEVDGAVKAPPPTRLDEADEFGFVRVVDRRADGSVVVDVDRADMLMGDEAAAAAAARGTEVENDYFLVNDNDRLRRYTVSSYAAVWGSSVLSGAPEAARTTLDRWLDVVPSRAGAVTLFHLDVESGVVVGIEEQYLP